MLGAEKRLAQWRELVQQPPVLTAVAEVTAALNGLQHCSQEAAPRGIRLANCFARCLALSQRWNLLTNPQSVPHSVHWFETRGRDFLLGATPLEIAAAFQERMAAQSAAWIFTSVTLAVGTSFAHFAGRLGLTEYSTLQLDNPFDFARNAFVPSTGIA